MKKKVIRLTESDIENLVKKIIKEDLNLHITEIFSLNNCLMDLGDESFVVESDSNVN